MKLKLVVAAVAAALLLAAPASADVGFPPSQYQSDGGAVTLYVSQTSLYRLCGVKPAEGMRLYGCVRRDRMMVLLNPCGPEFSSEVYARIACHELGHTNGWPGNHPRPDPAK